MSPGEDLHLHPPVDAFTDAAGKREFHRAAARWLRALAKEAGLAPGTFDVRSNKAGPAVAGEVILHGERIYVQVGDAAADPGLGVLWRTCQGRQDYAGNANRWWPWSRVEDIGALAAEIRRAMEEA